MENRNLTWLYADTQDFHSNRSEHENHSNGWSCLPWQTTAILAIIIGVINIVGNVATIVAFRRDPKIRKCYNYYAVNLSVIHIILDLTVLPLLVAASIQREYGTNYTIVCKMCWILFHVLHVEIASNLAHLCCEKWLIVNKGALYLSIQTPLKVMLQIDVVWCVSLLISLTILLHTELQNLVHEHGVCFPEHQHTPHLTSVLLFLSYLPQMIVILVFNCLILYEVIKKERASQSRVCLNPENVVITRPGPGLWSNFFYTAPRMSIFFCLCWLPYYVLLLTNYTATNVPQLAFEICLWLVLSNSVMGPIIYYTKKKKVPTATLR